MSSKIEENKDLVEFGKIMEVLGKNSETLMIKEHNDLVRSFVELFKTSVSKDE